MANTKNWKHDSVLVIGGGPVGAMCALMLAKKGVPVTLIEREAGMIEDYRASTFHAATLQLLEESGASEALLEMGLIAPLMQYRDRQRGKIVELDWSEIADETPYPFRVQCEQFKLTDWAYRQLEALPNAKLLFGHIVTGIDQDDTGVTLHTDTAAGPVSLIGDFAIGADGGRSTIRKALDIEFGGFTYPEHFIVAGTKFNFRSVLPDICSVNYVAGGRDWFLLLEIPDMWRIVQPVGPDVDPTEAMQDDALQTSLNRLAPRDEPYKIEIKAIYRVSQRVAKTFRQGRIFLAGDAAHINNPLGGVGLNGGLMDARSITDKLAEVWHGRSDITSLDGYQTQRKPEAILTVNTMTERNKKVLEESDPAIRERNLKHWRELGENKELRRQHMLEASLLVSARRCGLLC